MQRSACYRPWFCKIAHRSSQVESISMYLNPPTCVLKKYLIARSIEWCVWAGIEVSDQKT